VADLLKSGVKMISPLFTDRMDAGVFGEAMAGATQTVNASAGNSVTDALSNLWKVSGGPFDQAAGLVTSSSLQVALLIGCDGGKPPHLVFRIEVRSGRKLEINTPMAGSAGVRITGEKTSRLLAAGVDGGGADLEVLGVRARGRTNQRGKTNRV
jgi:hypothetical protein